MKRLMKGKERDKVIIVISPPVDLRHEKERVKQLMEEGLEFYHVRKPGYGRRDMEQYIRGYPASMRVRMIVHDHYELVEPYNLRGIHINERNKQQGYEAAHIDRHISISCHHTNELANLGCQYTYAFVSPVLDSLSKHEYRSAFQPDDLKHFLQNHKKVPPVIALGGIHPGSISKIQGAGFSGVALLGAIWPELTHPSHTDCPIGNYLQIKELVQAL